jgi:GTPase SAR1 family protein
LSYRIDVIGNRSTGKSSLFTKIVDYGASISGIKPTVVGDVPPIPQIIKSQEIRLDFWDFSDNAMDRSLMPVCIRKAQWVVPVFDLTTSNSFAIIND